jgi:hypothetical protein
VVAEHRLRAVAEERLGDAADLFRQEQMPDVVHQRRRGRVDADARRIPGILHERRGHHRDVGSVRGLVVEASRPGSLEDHPRARRPREHDLVRDREDAELVDGLVVAERARSPHEQIGDRGHEERGLRAGSCERVSGSHHEAQEDVIQALLRELSDATW